MDRTIGELRRTKERTRDRREAGREGRGKGNS